MNQEKAEKYAAERGVNVGSGSGGAQVGECNHQYINGDSAPQYRALAFQYWPHRCLCCGYTQRLVVHHLDGDRGNAGATNLAPLCGSCHRSLHARARTVGLSAAAEEKRPGILELVVAHVNYIDGIFAEVKSRNEAGNPGDGRPEPKRAGNTANRGND